MQEKFTEVQRAIAELKKMRNPEMDDFSQNFTDLNNMVNVLKMNPEEIRRLNNNIKELDERKLFHDSRENIMKRLNEIEDNIGEAIEEAEEMKKKLALVNEEDEKKEESLTTSLEGLKIMKLEQNDQFLKKRREELENLKVTSAQINAMSNQMRVQVDQQGDMLESIEDHVAKAEDNVKMAEDEVKKANTISKKQRKKIICLVIAISLVIFAIIAILCGFIFNKKNKSQ